MFKGKKGKQKQGKKGETLNETTETVTRRSTVSSSYTETKICRTTTSSLQIISSSSLSSGTNNLKLDNPRTSRNSIFNVSDAQPIKPPALKPISSSYNSVYVRGPSSTYVPRHPVTNSNPSSNSPLSSPIKNSFASTVSPSAAVLSSKNPVPNLQQVKQPLKVKVKITGKKYDEGESKVPMYKTSSKNKARVLVINNIKFVDEKEHRLGAELDEKNMVALFKQMGMKVVTYRDKKKSEMEKIITGYRKDSSLKQVDINIVVIMSHGTGAERHDSTEVVGIDHQLLPTTWILQEFDNENCPYLCNKPKIFIFQCCRGSEQDVQKDAVPFTPLRGRRFADMLIAYSTVPGFVSYRDPQTGTWYIQTICEVFMEHAHDTDVEGMLKMVDHKLEKIVTACHLKQTTSFENRGFKTCYLHPK